MKFGLEVSKVTINTFKLESLLAEHGLTKTALADACGICRQSLSVIMRRKTCEPKTAGKLAAGLGVSVEEIVEKEG